MKAVPEPAQLKKRKPFGLSSGPLAPA
jgi:hypothetical protein